MANTQEDPNRDYYQSFYKFSGKSSWMEKIWREAFGENFPEGLDHFGYVTRHDLSEIAALLQVAAGSSLLDLGCGKGGPGLKLAEELHLQLTGVDLVPEAIQQARDFQTQFRLDYPATFLEGQFYAIPLPDQSMDSVISIDALWTAPDKIKALIEVKRVMKPGAKFIFTHWDYLAIDPVPLLEQSGLSFISREDTPNWKSYQEKVYAGILAHREELTEEMGDAAKLLISEAETVPAYLDFSVRRIYVMELR